MVLNHRLNHFLDVVDLLLVLALIGLQVIPDELKVAIWAVATSVFLEALDRSLLNLTETVLQRAVIRIHDAHVAESCLDEINKAVLRSQPVAQLMVIAWLAEAVRPAADD